MLLSKKVAVVYGAGGAIGGAVSRAFARAGARVVLAGRTQDRLDKVADQIESDGGAAETAVVDALDEEAVTAFADSVVERHARVDISFNLIGFGDVQRPLMELSVDDFTQPIATLMRTHFLTTRAAARHMINQGSGVVLAFGGSGPDTIAGIGSLKVAFDALEGQRRQWAYELGRYGIRVVTLKTGGIPESIPDELPGMDEVVADLNRRTLLGRTATLTDVGDVACFIASDHARSITSTEINISCGAMVD
jgi:NAD(P)-dependent dehydrogenase (short-subunit alcohol dehydrogenase family)